MTSEKPEGVPPHELLLWTRRFAAMVDSGVSLMRCMSVLVEEETTPAMRDITRMLMTAVENGATLSEVMGGELPQSEEKPKHFASLPQDWWARMRATFDADYIATVRVGEVGGILDVALDRLVDRYERGLAPLPPVEPERVPRAELAEWFWRFAEMLEAGVPLLYALNTLKRVSRPPLRQLTEEMQDEVYVGMSLLPEEGEPPTTLRRYPGLFTPTLLTLVDFGLPYGCEALRKVITLLEGEARLEREGKLPPLSAQPSTERPAELGESREHPVVRAVNDLYITAIRERADSIAFSRPTEHAGGRAILLRDGQVLQTIPLERFAQCVRRVKVNADIDPFSQEDRRSQIHVGYQGQKYVLHVHSRPTFEGGYLWLMVRAEEGAVEL